MTTPDLARAAWRKSSRSGDNGGQCVEVADLGATIAVRDSKDPDGPAILVDRAQWRAFVHAIAPTRR